MISFQNNGKTTAGGVTGRGFRPGESGNPGGRPKGFAKLVCEATKDGQEIVSFMVQVLHGKKIGTRTPKIADSIRAAEWLADRGFGKPETTNVNLNTETYSIDELATAIARHRIKERMAKPPEITPETKDDRH